MPHCRDNCYFNPLLYVYYWLCPTHQLITIGDEGPMLTTLIPCSMYVHTFEGESKEDGFGKLGGEGDKRQQHTHMHSSSYMYLQEQI
jgi:hypothetical protein